MHDVTGLPRLLTRDDLLTCLYQDPTDRFVIRTHDLGCTEFDKDGFAKRVDTCAWLVCSLRTASATSISMFIS